MESFLLYLLKSAGVLFLFYSCYHLFLAKETFFKLNRWFLLLGLFMTLAFPLLYITKTVFIPLNQNGIGGSLGEQTVQLTQTTTIAWTSIFMFVYLLGVLVCVFRLFFQLKTLNQIFRNSKQEKLGSLAYLKTKEDVKPFSFFRNIVYNPSTYNAQELQMIMAHEAVHARQGHSFDILCTEIIASFQWFNPFAWLYQKALKQNLEFLADFESLAAVKHKKQYQYVLLKQAVDKNPLSIINPFFNSLIKKRIVMINKKKSSSRNLIKYSFVVPLLAAFLLLFNTRIEAKIQSLGTVPPQNNHPQIGNSKVYSISKQTTDTGIKALKEKINADKGTLIIEELERNQEGLITSLAIKFQLPDQFVTGSGANKDGIQTMFFGLNEKGGVFFTSDETGLDEMTKGIPPKKRKYKSNSISVQSPNLRLHLNGGEEETVLGVNGKEPLIVLDGNIISKTELDRFYPQNIANISVLKGEAAVIMYGTKAKDGVIQITSKPQNGVAGIQVKGSIDGEIPLYILDGKEITKRQMEELDQDTIKSVNVWKGEKAIQKYGEKGKQGVVEITTKEH